MFERIADGPVNLRDAAQGIGILHAATVAMRVTDFALFEQAAKIGSSFDLPSVGARLLDALVESDVGSLEGIRQVPSAEKRFSRRMPAPTRVSEGRPRCPRNLPAGPIAPVAVVG